MAANGDTPGEGAMPVKNPDKSYVMSQQSREMIYTCLYHLITS